MSRAFLVTLIFISSFFSVAPYVFAQPTGPLPTLLPDCDPAMPPNARRGEFVVPEVRDSQGRIISPARPEFGRWQKDPCDVNRFLELLKNVINWLFIIVTPISVVLISYGGILILISGSNPSLFQKGKEVIKAAVWGIVIAFSAWAIMYTLYTLVLRIERQPQYWPFT